ncbi:SpoIIE family protein phosphatase [Streptomyces sp. NPDC089799]|uniref:SpoIIE family protein phosphatase n=1 Tax=Streptomyces sp. NPDC089799 TaxID=3155066 RepID=UPI0034190B9A
MPPHRPVGDDDAGPIRSEPGSLLEHVPVAVFGIDDRVRICWWGPGARHLFGYDAPEALAGPAARLFPEEPVPPGDLPPAALLVERARTLGYWRGRMPVRHRDGTVFPCGFRVFPVAGPGGGSVVLGLASRSKELDRVKTNLSFLDALFETCPIGLVMLDQDLRYVHLNQALAAMDGLSVQDHLGRRTDEVMLTHDGGAFRDLLESVARGGRTVVGTLVGLRTSGLPDRDQVRSVSLFPLSGAVGTGRGVGGLFIDVTDRERAILDATAARQRLQLLDRATARIGTTLDVDVTARELVEAAVPDFCDAAVVELVRWADERAPFDPALPLVTRRIAHLTTLPPPAPELVGGMETITYPPGSGIHDMLSTGRPLCVAVDEEFTNRTVTHQQRARLLLESGLACITIAPLVARGTVQGLAMFGRSAARPAFDEADLSLAGELASRAALSLDNARLYSRVRDISLTLQRALLPTAPAAGPYVELAHRYLPGSHITEVGGDWYDAIALPGDRVALVVGDVMGHGVPAAAAMGRLRITAEAVARHTPEPEALLTELDAAARDTGIEFATCLYLVYDPHTGRARIANAGHPPLLVRHPDGTVETVGEVLGVPLGVGGVPFASMDVELPEGSVLALYTDGLVETRDRDLDAGIAALARELGSAGAAGSLEAAADHVLARMLPDSATDDTVLVLARVHRTA